MKRKITDFHQDNEEHWVADLDCGHCQHTRHNPPLIERTWVLTKDGRDSHLGTELDCVNCDRREIPERALAYHRTEIFNELTIPEPLQKNHHTKHGVWGKICILEGSLYYKIKEPFNSTELIDRDHFGIIVPDIEHHIEANGAVRFFVEFLRVQ